MIDTDKYEGELEYRMNKEFCNDIACGHMNKDLAIQYAHEFYSNSLELLAEVKRLREVERTLMRLVTPYVSTAQIEKALKEYD